MDKLVIITAVSIIFSSLVISLYMLRKIKTTVSKMNIIVDSLDDMLYVTDLDYNIIYMNHKVSEIYGISEKKSYNKKCYKVFSNGADKPCALCPLPTLLRYKEEFPTFEWDRYLEDVGMWLVCKTTLMRWVDGSWVQLNMSKDGTFKKEQEAIQQMFDEELNRAKMKAEEASNAKSSFLAHMSHEIRTPMNAIIGMSGIARNSVEDSEKLIYSIDQIILSSKHLLGILNNVLDMSKIESGKLELVCKPFSLMEACNEVSAIITQRCSEKNISYVTNINDISDITIIGDKLRLKQVLINLLGNSVKFTDNSGEVKFLINVINESEKDILLSYSILDNGIGMSEDQISKLFNPFEQTDSSIAAKFGGTGLGLSISQRLVEMMGGEIKVESKPNIGSKFYFELYFEKGATKLESLSEMIEAVDLSGKRVLLVEDIQINRIIIFEILSITGIEIDEAEDGKQALDIFKESPPGFYQLIFMDVQMPVMNGYEATRQIRALEREDAKSIPIVAMTANAYREDVDEALSVGMNGHVSKPIDSDVLMKSLMDFLL